MPSRSTGTFQKRRTLNPQRLRRRAEKSSKRVKQGELVSFLRKEATNQLTPGTLQSAAGQA
ncbi:MAG: hypothetical protein CMJ70_12630 [Planctomycetaceae bacterium]|nr:hypothetical protein [Planctomycetaceae bacterium]